MKISSADDLFVTRRIALHKYGKTEIRGNPLVVQVDQPGEHLCGSRLGYAQVGFFENIAHNPIKVPLPVERSEIDVVFVEHEANPERTRTAQLRQCFYGHGQLSLARIRISYERSSPVDTNQAGNIFSSLIRSAVTVVDINVVGIAAAALQEFDAVKDGDRPVRPLVVLISLSVFGNSKCTVQVIVVRDNQQTVSTDFTLQSLQRPAGARAVRSVG